jgi:hypothetical protein
MERKKSSSTLITFFVICIGVLLLSYEGGQAVKVYRSSLVKQEYKAIPQKQPLRTSSANTNQDNSPAAVDNGAENPAASRDQGNINIIEADNMSDSRSGMGGMSRGSRGGDLGSFGGMSGNNFGGRNSSGMGGRGGRGGGRGGMGGGGGQFNGEDTGNVGSYGGNFNIIGGQSDSGGNINVVEGNAGNEENNVVIPEQAVPAQSVPEAVTEPGF